jgi:hypothetical protein
MIFKNHRKVPVSVFRVKITAAELLRRVTRRFLELLSNFIEGKGSQFVSYSKIMRTISTHTKVR